MPRKVGSSWRPIFNSLAGALERAHDGVEAAADTVEGVGELSVPVVARSIEEVIGDLGQQQLVAFFESDVELRSTYRYFSERILAQALHLSTGCLARLERAVQADPYLGTKELIAIAEASTRIVTALKGGKAPAVVPVKPDHEKSETEIDAEILALEHEVGSTTEE